MCQICVSKWLFRLGLQIQRLIRTRALIGKAAKSSIFSYLKEYCTDKRASEVPPHRFYGYVWQKSMQYFLSVVYIKGKAMLKPINPYLNEIGSIGFMCIVFGGLIV